jgi:hypothetical protein
LSNIALRHLKVARFNDLNDPFELLAVDVAERNLRIGMAAKKKQIDLTASVYPTPHRCWPSVPIPLASDKPRWTEPPPR